MSSAVHHFIGNESEYDWENAIPKNIPTDSTAKLVKGKVILGPQDETENFVFRYFVIEPGGNTTMPDQHRHDHGIIILHGSGEVHLSNEVHPIAANDMIYIAANEVHGIVNTGDVPLGLVCVIPNKDRLDEYLKLSEKK